LKHEDTIGNILDTKYSKHQPQRDTFRPENIMNQMLLHH